MGTHMKTTVEISDALLAEAKAVARAQRTTLRDLIEAGLRQQVGERRAERRFQLRDESFEGDGLRAGLEWGDWEAMRDLAYEGRGS